jgi:hypothetical protein
MSRAVCALAQLTFYRSLTMNAVVSNTTAASPTGELLQQLERLSFTKFLEKHTQVPLAYGGFEGEIAPSIIRDYLTKAGIVQLDALVVDVGLARALKVPPQVVEIARGLVAQGFISSTPPSEYNPLESNSRSFYFDPRVITDAGILKTNLDKVVIPILHQMGALKENGAEDLDLVRQHVRLATAVGLKGDNLTRATVLAAKLLDLGYFSPIAPDSQALTFGSYYSRYLSDEVITDPNIRESNLRKIIETRLKNSGVRKDNIDTVIVDTGLAGILHVPEKSRKSAPPLAAALISAGYLTPKLPENFEFKERGMQSYYLDPAVIHDEEILKYNKSVAIKQILIKHGAIKEHGVDLDEVPTDDSLGILLGISPGKNLKLLISRELVRQGYATSQIPENHPLTYNSSLNLSPIC